MDRAEKREMVESLNDIFSTSGSVVVARYKGMTVAQMSDLRRKMGDAGAKFKVIKNRLAKIALDSAADGAGADLFLEPTGIAFGQDPTAAAKVAADFAKTNDKFVIVGGLLGSAGADADGVKALAAIPSHERASFHTVGRASLHLAQNLCGSLMLPRKISWACCKPTRKSKKRRDGLRQSFQSPTNHRMHRGLNVR